MTYIQESIYIVLHKFECQMNSKHAIENNIIFPVHRILLVMFRKFQLVNSGQFHSSLNMKSNEMKIYGHLIFHQSTMIVTPNSA